MPRSFQHNQTSQCRFYVNFGKQTAAGKHCRSKLLPKMTIETKFQVIWLLLLLVCVFWSLQKFVNSVDVERERERESARFANESIAERHSGRTRSWTLTVNCFRFVGLGLSKVCFISVPLWHLNLITKPTHTPAKLFLVFVFFSILLFWTKELSHEVILFYCYERPLQLSSFHSLFFTPRN